MGELVNLRRAKKAKARLAAETEAGAQRLLHGRTKSETFSEKSRLKAAERRLDGHRREKSPNEEPPSEEQGK